MKNHYVVIPNNTDLNRGDQALIWESIRLSEDSGLIGQYYLMECGLTEEEMHLQSWQTKEKGYEFISPILLHPGRGKKTNENSHMYSYSQLLKWGFQALGDFISSSLLLSKNKSINSIAKKMMSKEQLKALDVISKSKAVIVKGGGFLHSYGRITDVYYMYYSLYHIYLAERLGVPVIIMPNSFGPFEGIFINKMVKSAFKKAHVITARESISQKVVKDEIKIDADLMPDLGFFLENSKKMDMKDYLRQKSVPLGIKKCVAMTLRPYRFPKSEDPNIAYKNYINSIVAFAQWLRAEDYHLIMVAHTLGPSKHEDDRIAIKDVLDNINDKSNITYIEDLNLDCEDIKSLYGEVDYVIGTRFHSVIFAMACGTPSIAISYGGNKGEGIMKDMKLDEYEISIEDINEDNLKMKFIKLIEEEVIAKEKISDYIKYSNNKRKEFIDIIRSKVTNII